MKIQEPGGETETHPERLRRTTLEGSEEWFHVDCIAPPPGQYSPSGRKHSWASGFLQWEKRAQGGHVALPALQGAS